MNRNSAEYWNQPQTKADKPFDVDDSEDKKWLDYARRETNLETCFRDAVAYLPALQTTLRGQVFDVCAGVCWASAIVAEHDSVERVDAGDFSEHRMMHLGPRVIAQYACPADRIKRICGPVEATLADAPDGNYDFVVFCQALYMFAKPHPLLALVHRKLKKGGIVIVACEGIEATPSRTQILRDEFYAMRHSPRQFLRYHSANGWTFAYAPVDESGRHRFTDVQYTRALKRTGFDVARQVLDYPVFPDSGVNAINYFGIKR